MQRVGIVMCVAGGWEALSTQTQISLTAKAVLHTLRRLISGYSLTGVSCLSEGQAQVGATEGRSRDRHTWREPFFLGSAPGCCIVPYLCASVRILHVPDAKSMQHCR